MKYRPYKPLNINRKWPSNILTKEPRWCSVDLRDGNQSLLKPMNIDKKIKFFNKLVEIGFKEIEIGFPSASQVEYDFLRKLINENHIPEDVKIQVLVQAREHLIEKTFESLEGSKNAIVHFYNSTSTLQRKIVFKKEKNEIIDIALNGLNHIKNMSKYFKGNLELEYSPESFTGTELDFALEICNNVIDEYNPQKKDLIINLPATVEMTMPNIYADQIEWMAENLNKREEIILSLHTHNDRGTAVAATELGLLAGADRVEGTILGNGERTGNSDILTLAMNMYSQGMDTSLDFSNIDSIVKTVEECTEIKTHIRHPYAGEMVYTAFSGSHQDAIKKGMDYMEENEENSWEVPYLPIDPKDVGRDYEKIILINSQSGKGGVSHVLKEKYNYEIPKEMEPIIGKIVQEISDTTDGVLSDKIIFDIFQKTFINNEKFKINNFKIENTQEDVSLFVDLSYETRNYNKGGSGNGPLEAFKKCLTDIVGEFQIINYYEHSKGNTVESEAVSYIKIKFEEKEYWGVGEDKNITHSSFKALLSALKNI